MEGLKYEIGMNEKDTLVIHLNGYIDTTTVNSFRKIFQDIENIDFKRVFFNFDGVEYVSSSGWGTLISNAVRMKAKGVEIHVGRMAPGVKRIFDLMDLSRFVNYTDEIPSIGKKVSPVKEKEVPEVNEKLLAFIKNIIVDNPFVSETDLRKQVEAKTKRKLNEKEFKEILKEIGLETREKRLAFAYKTLKRIIKSKK